jgi:hypothetical protein
VDILGLNVFWSGGKEDRSVAEAFANSIGDNILEMTPQGIALEQWTKGMEWAEAEPLWTSTSANFAGGSKGTTHVFIYEPNYRGTNSVWETTELSILKEKGLTIIEHRIQSDETINIRKLSCK